LVQQLRLEHLLLQQQELFRQVLLDNFCVQYIHLHRRLRLMRCRLTHRQQ
jgi:hypothetical protein